MRAYESRDIFRRLHISVGFWKSQEDGCQLCGINPPDKGERFICAQCVQCLVIFTQKDKQKIYNHLIDLGDKQRAKTFLKHFQVYKKESTLKKIRSALKMTQEVFAKRIGIRRCEVAQIEAGIRPYNENIQYRVKKMLQKQGGTI